MRDHDTYNDCCGTNENHFKDCDHDGTNGIERYSYTSKSKGTL